MAPTELETPRGPDQEEYLLIAHSVAPTARPDTRELRGEEILISYQGGGRWLVPSGTAANGLYEVRAGVRPERNRCECRGFASHRHCSHIVAAERVGKRSGVCDGCGERAWRRDLFEVGADHLTWFEGDELCRTCATRAGVR